jgi:hypothetical protein
MAGEDRVLAEKAADLKKYWRGGWGFDAAWIMSRPWRGRPSPLLSIDH